MPADRDDPADAPPDASDDGDDTGSAAGGHDDGSTAGGRDAGSETAGSDGALGAAWGGPVDDADGESGDGDATGAGGPLPSAEEVRARNVAANETPQGPQEASVLDRITIALQDHKTAFTVALLVYALLVMPWLYANDLGFIGLLGGAVFLGGVVLLTVANAHKAQSALRGDERRGF
jgi:hypothetical protein